MRILGPETTPTRLLDPAERRQVVIRPLVQPSRLWFVGMFIDFVSWTTAIAWLRFVRRLPTAELALRIRNYLEEMGGLWIKAGQLIAMRRDILSKEMCDEIAKLQDQSYGFAPETARAIIEEELGGPIDWYFDEFSDLPFGAASIGQIHRAHLRQENVWVAVKVQRPNIAWLFYRQLAFLRFVANIMVVFRILPELRPGELLWEIEKIVQEELDYRCEASNIRRMRKTLKPHGVGAPKVFGRYCAARILVMEFIHGALMADYIRVQTQDPKKLERWLQENNIDPLIVARRLYLSLLRQCFEDNLFHGDMHPGNIILLRDSQVALIDFGSIGSIETEWQRKYCMFYRSLAAREYSKAVDLLFLLCPNLPPFDVAELKEKLIFIMRNWESRAATKGLPYHEKSIFNLFEKFARTMRPYNIPFNFQFLKNDRAGITLDASLFHLSPDASYTKLLKRYFREAARRAYLKEMRSQNLPRDLIGITSVLGAIPELINDYRLFQEPVLRRQAQSYQGSVTKIAFLFASIFRTLASGFLLGGGFLLLVFLRQHHESWFNSLGGDALFQFTDAVPHLSIAAWVLIFAIVFYGWRKTTTLHRQFAKVDVRQ